MNKPSGLVKGLIIAAPSSGSGKTVLTLGLLRHLAGKGKPIASAKAGPDYIDPSYHKLAAGIPSRNLDSWLLPHQIVSELFHKASEWMLPLDPPLVALDITPGRGAFLPYFTLGGLDTLPTGEVLNTSGKVIAGLFAAGRNACGVVRTAAGYSSGMSVGDATFSGRLAGIQATRDIA